MHEPQPRISIRSLKKDFAGKVVLDGIDLDVGAGRIVGYLGANGAGKSTTIKILMGLLGDYSGEVRVDGFDPRTHALEIKARVGYVPENAVLYETLTVAEYLLFVGRLHGMADDLVRTRAERMLAAFELSDRIPARIGTLSKGMRQKVLLTSALLHAPKVLFVDEPLSGLDVNAAILVKSVFRGLADDGCTILYSSHVMDVVQQICDRIVILDGGRVAAQGTFAELSAARAGSNLESIFADVTSRGGEEDRAQEIVASLR